MISCDTLPSFQYSESDFKKHCLETERHASLGQVEIASKYFRLASNVFVGLGCPDNLLPSYRLALNTLTEKRFVIEEIKSEATVSF